MFVCDPCLTTIPETPTIFRRRFLSFFHSVGACEICGVTDECLDVPTKDLPVPA